jgi:hypothetical protein
MVKFFLINLMILTAAQAYAEAPCDIRPGISVGIKVVEFSTGNTIHSKMPLRESTAQALLEEMTNLQDMGICEERILSQKCILKLEKHQSANLITMYRGKNKWNSWVLKSKEQAQNYVKGLRNVGFCS